MTNIDEKLREIVQAVWDNGDGAMNDMDVDAALPKIKQAFTDAGYISKLTSDAYLEASGYLTGQEWYDRFEDAISEMSQQQGLLVDYTFNRFVQAAKRAAGLEENK